MRRLPIKLRFSLKSFLVVFSILAVILGWRTNFARTQREAVATIQSSGGTVLFDYHEKGPRTWSSSGTPRGPEWLRKAIGSEYFERVSYVGLFNTPPENQWVEAVNDLGTVKTLLLSGENVTDETLKRFDASSALLELHLTSTAITDDGFRQLVKFPNLRWLIANNTSISDRGMEALAPLQQLRELNIRHTSVPDVAVSSISALTNLQKLDVRETALSDEGVNRLKVALPNARIRH